MVTLYQPYFQSLEQVRMDEQMTVEEDKKPQIPTKVNGQGHNINIFVNILRS